jgi:hypothetical protein
MTARTPPSWEPVETFGAWALERGQLRLVDSAIASAALDCRRFQSTAGERAILLPVRSVTGREDELISVADLADDVTDLLFVDPPSAATAQGLVQGLVEMLGERAASIRVALTEEADPAGLAADTGRVTVTVGPGSTMVYRLYRLDLGEARRLPPGPRPGESVDVLDQRSKWFTTRHGGRS